MVDVSSARLKQGDVDLANPENHARISQKTPHSMNIWDTSQQRERPLFLDRFLIHLSNFYSSPLRYDSEGLQSNPYTIMYCLLGSLILGDSVVFVSLEVQQKPEALQAQTTVALAICLGLKSLEPRSRSGFGSLGIKLENGKEGGLADSSQRPETTRPGSSV